MAADFSSTAGRLAMQPAKEPMASRYDSWPDRQQNGDCHDGRIFHFKNAILHAEQLPLPEIAAAVETPFYCYSSAAIRDSYLALAEAVAPLPARICYAVKANGNLSVLRSLARLGAGADVVSGGELLRACAAGMAPGNIVFSGIGKTEAELRLALTCQVGHINVESAGELDLLARLCREQAKPMTIRLRVNPDLDAGTHAKITTGTAESKFGIAWAELPALYRRAQGLSGIVLQGLALHIGSQILDLERFRVAFRRLAEMVQALRNAGMSVIDLDLGGGLGIDYIGKRRPDYAGYAAIIGETLGQLQCKLTIEPGRCLVARSGLLVTRVINIKPAPQGYFVVVDAAMNDLLRPALYDAVHTIRSVRQMTAASAVPCHIVGPVCESSDVFARNLAMPLPAIGDLLAIENAGAYGAVMASTYNARPLIPEVLVDGDRHAVVRRRLSVYAMLQQEPLAPWL